MYDVHIVYTGIVALVQRRFGNVTAVLKNLTGSPNSHQAHILAETSRVGTNRPPSISGNHRLDPQRRLSAWYLQGDEIRVANTINGGSGVSTNASYVIQMSDVFYDYGIHFSPALLTTNDPTLIAGRMQINSGALSATWVDPQWYWDFVRLNGMRKPDHQFIAEEVCLNFSIPEQPLLLEVTRATGSYMLAVAANAEGRIEVRIGNQPVEDIILPPHPKDCDPTKPDCPDADFPMYYDMAEVIPSVAPELRGNAATTPLPNPPQKSHAHSLTMVSVANPMTLAAFAKSSVGVAALAHAGGGGFSSTGGHNCPPTLWNE
jgi:hypothetical protein